jgi:CRISPR-associated protein Cmr1
VAGTWPPDVPHLLQQPTSDWIRVLPFPNQSAMDAWVALFSTLKDFRHQRPGSTKLIKGSMRNVPGRNRWPEPDAVRRLTKSRSTRHTHAISDLNKFPRAVFGLPIIFEFNPDDRKDGDPKGKYTLMGKSKDDKNVERLASPLILRTLARSNGAVGIALVLAGNRLPDQLILTQERHSWDVAATLTQDEANTIMQTDNRTPLLGDETNVLRAFLKYLEHKVNP